MKEEPGTPINPFSADEPPPPPPETDIRPKGDLKEPINPQPKN